MPRFLHTADWQLGLRLNYITGDKGAELRRQRFRTVERIAEVAQARQVDVVLVAGDVFDDNRVGQDTVQLAVDALKGFGNLPVVLLPGNHDAGTRDSVLAGLQGQLPHVTIALTPEPLTFGRLEVHPCPLLTRHTFEDPTRHLPQREHNDQVRVALAHGGVIDFSESEDTVTPNVIDADRVLDKGFDYLALGDWHGRFSYNERVWYSGAPEATRFKEKDPGYVLVVEIDGPGERPRVESVPVQQTRWLQQAFELNADHDLARLTDWFEALERPSATLVELSLRGTLSLQGRSELEALLDGYEARLAYLRRKNEQIVDEPSEADWAQFQQLGLVQQALEKLNPDESETDADAVRLLHRLLKEVA